MKHVLVIQHMLEDSIGLLGEMMQERSILFDTVYATQDPLPDLIHYDALIVLGGLEYAGDDEVHPYLNQEKALIRQAVAQDIPYLGICLGGQLLAHAMGAQVLRNAQTEIGFSEPQFTWEGKQDRFFQGLPGYQQVFHWHSDTFEVPASGVLLAKGENGVNQAFRFGERAYGLQYHIELTPEMFDTWLSFHPYRQEAIELLGRARYAQIEQEREDLYALYRSHSRMLFENFLSIAGLCPSRALPLMPLEPALSQYVPFSEQRARRVSARKEEVGMTHTLHRNRSAGAPSILITECIAQEGIELLRKHLPSAQIDICLGLTSGQLRAAIGQYTALIVRSETRVTSDILAAATHLKIVGRAGVGLDNIDTEAAKRHGIAVVNSPGGNTVAAAEHTIALLLALARHIPTANSSTKAGGWEKSRFMGVQVRNKVLGILGLGKVGKEVARCAQGLGMQVIAFDPYVAPSQAHALDVTMLSLEDVLEQADFVTLHTTLTNGTRGLLGADELSLLKPGARLINCARGALINEEALLHALQENRLAGVALDVFSQEPIRDNAVLQQLLADDRVIATPHLGASTQEAQIQVAINVVEQIVFCLQDSVFSAA